MKVRALACVVTGRTPVDVHHVKTKGSYGDDVEWNLIPLIHEKHMELHQLGNERFANKYINFKLWLFKNDWEFDHLKNKWVHRRT